MKRPLAALALLALVWLVVALGAPLLGPGDLDLGQALGEDSIDRTILWRLRVPRVLLGLLGGAILAMTGVAFQTLFRNALAEPYTLGVAGGAALGAVAALQFMDWSSIVGFSTVTVASFLGAAAVGLVLVALARTRKGSETGTLLLAGIAISLSCSALILFIQYLADFTRSFRMVRWMMGGLAVVGYREVLWVLPWAIVGGLLLFAKRHSLDLLLAGEEIAASRGLDLDRTRWVVLAVVSAMVGSLVAVAGPIGFIGLIVPHILRRFVGSTHAVLIPACFFGGGAFLAVCDLAARTVMAPAELPVGVLTALLGGPFFLWLLMRRPARR
jgi:iron complex transport system permease protein